MKRHLSRETVLQILYERDITENLISDILIKKEIDVENIDEDFVKRILKEIEDKLLDIDEFIEKYSIQWKVERMSVIDRNILRLAVFEMLYCSDIPRKVAINEAIELSKEYGSANSPKFINGILGKALEDLD